VNPKHTKQSLDTADILTLEFIDRKMLEIIPLGEFDTDAILN
jgi:hypothetical protein